MNVLRSYMVSYTPFSHMSLYYKKPKSIRYNNDWTDLNVKIRIKSKHNLHVLFRVIAIVIVVQHLKTFWSSLVLPLPSQGGICCDFRPESRRLSILCFCQLNVLMINWSQISHYCWLLVTFVKADNLHKYRIVDNWVLLQVNYYRASLTDWIDYGTW